MENKKFSKWIVLLITVCYLLFNPSMAAWTQADTTTTEPETTTTEEVTTTTEEVTTTTEEVTTTTEEVTTTTEEVTTTTEEVTTTTEEPTTTTEEVTTTTEPTTTTTEEVTTTTEEPTTTTTETTTTTTEETTTTTESTTTSTTSTTETTTTTTESTTTTTSSTTTTTTSTTTSSTTTSTSTSTTTTSTTTTTLPTTTTTVPTTTTTVPTTTTGVPTTTTTVPTTTTTTLPGPYTITATVNSNSVGRGTIEVESDASCQGDTERTYTCENIPVGSSKNFKMTPYATPQQYYIVEYIIDKGTANERVVPVNPASSTAVYYNFTNVTADHTIEVTFGKVFYTYSSDDAEEDSLGHVNVTGKEIAVSDTSGAAGFRFRNFQINQNCDIFRGSLVFQIVPDMQTDGEIELEIWAQYAKPPAGDPPAFSTSNSDISRRLGDSNYNVTSSTKWRWTASDIYPRIDVTDMLQEIINTSAWVPKSPINFIIKVISGTGSRGIVSYDGSTYYGKSAPMLSIVYNDDSCEVPTTTTTIETTTTTTTTQQRCRQRQRPVRQRQRPVRRRQQR